MGLFDKLMSPKDKKLAIAGKIARETAYKTAKKAADERRAKEYIQKQIEAGRKRATFKEDLMKSAITTGSKVVKRAAKSGRTYARQSKRRYSSDLMPMPSKTRKRKLSRYEIGMGPI